ncbi:Hypothetical protein EMIHUDRAFT_231600 [Emiliania huxleyi CCMP1516]|uniref:AP2/ERF domain-containing protein n=2 Tax=Emiliania huxleyi TaxID=2903 RepID=A0A0D3K794_EMIH1|nr:Hypothetical protein EMIHUDRAFT_231600 [Emiliania huxleyi CCMP1516]EOD31629.1 Hypothetical protein EMIHUDRAFT_231600 [Emiliania huxleyi CCMP1516]|eukprot:XP_005784058.1 Hypothetical protein EMIHUDRAFT_231600 [Emiliania huxleyi CCMP1516]
MSTRKGGDYRRKGSSRKELARNQYAASLRHIQLSQSVAVADATAGGRAGSARTELMPLAPRTEALAASEPGKAASEPQGAAFATEAEGLRLHLSSSSNTGYQGVYNLASGRFEAKRKVDGRTVHLGYFATAVEAAVAYARAMSEASAVAASASKSAPPAEPAGETILCGRTHERDGGAIGCVLPAGHAGQHAFTLQGKRARCVKRPFDPTDVEAEERSKGASRQDGEESEVEVEAAAGKAALAGSEAMSSQEAPVAEAEGLRLHLSSSSTGYLAVYEQSGRFQAQHRVDGRHVYVGLFDTAVEAAVAYAKAVGEYQPPTVATEAEGLRLHLSSRSSTGYRGVYEHSGRFAANHSLLPEHLPHQRALCPLHPFHAAEGPVAAPVDGNEAACPNCYCLICDARVSECGHWRGGDAPAHCNAHSNSALWRQKRVNAKRQRTRAVRAAQALVDPQPAMPFRSGLRSGLG